MVSHRPRRRRRPLPTENPRWTYLLYYTNTLYCSVFITLHKYLNRIDDTIIFHPLQRDEIAKIVDLQVSVLSRQLEQHGVDLLVTPAARKQIAARGYDPAYGARPLKRIIQRSIQNPLATEILKNEFQGGDCVTVDFRDGEFCFQHRKPAATVETQSVA